jgi:FO synthase
MATAHRLGLGSTATMMFGHVDGPRSWANHLEVIRRVQAETGGFTEFVPLPFVHMGAPIWLRGRSRPGPTWDEVVLAHAVARLAFDGLIPNIQASWVKLGIGGGQRLLAAGCNDFGGTLMGEIITRSAGAAHGQEVTPTEFEDAIAAIGRVPAQRTTRYEILSGA